MDEIYIIIIHLSAWINHRIAVVLSHNTIIRRTLILLFDTIIRYPAAGS